jgi:hypothetical protein
VPKAKSDISKAAKVTHKRMQLQDVWGVEGLLVYCYGSGRSSKHLRVGGLFGGRIACFCGCSKLYSGSGFAQHTDNTKHRPLQTVFLLGTKMRLQDALRQVRDSGASPQDLQSREIAADGAQMVQDLYSQPGMHSGRAIIAPSGLPHMGEAAKMSAKVASSATAAAGAATCRAPTDSHFGLQGVNGDFSGCQIEHDLPHDEDGDVLLDGFLGEDACQGPAFGLFDSNGEDSGLQLPRVTSIGPDGDAVPTFLSSSSIFSARVPHAATAISAAQTVLSRANAAASAAASASNYRNMQQASGKSTVTASTALHDPVRIRHLVEQHPLASVEQVSLCLAEAILTQQTYNGVAPFSSLSAADVEPEKLRKVGLASPSSSFSVHVLHTQLFTAEQRVAAASAAAALVPEVTLEARDSVPVAVPPELGRRTPAAELERIFLPQSPLQASQPLAVHPSALAATPSELRQAASTDNSASFREYDQQPAITAGQAVDAFKAEHRSPTRSAAKRKGGSHSSTVDVTHVTFTVQQAEEIERLAQPGLSDAAVLVDSTSLTVPVWVPLRAPAVIIAKHRGWLTAGATGAMAQLPLLLRAGMRMDCLYQGNWWMAQVKRVSGDKQAWEGNSRRLKSTNSDTKADDSWGTLVHYIGWSSKHDEWVVGDLAMATKFAPLGTYTDPLKLLT